MARLSERLSFKGTTLIGSTFSNATKCNYDEGHLPVSESLFPGLLRQVAVPIQYADLDANPGPMNWEWENSMRNITENLIGTLIEGDDDDDMNGYDEWSSGEIDDESAEDLGGDLDSE
ncbi:hypothetical protein LIA77_08765 [Sarocladium implicatum]|nr:hypothetical protein LIA77_08765 [Sarocladium implicatum]